MHGILPERICEGPRRLTPVHVEDIAVAVVGRRVDGVVVGQEAVLLEALPLVEAYRTHIRGEDVEVDGLTVVLIRRQEVGEETVEEM